MPSATDQPHPAALPARDPEAALTLAGGDAGLAAELFAALLAGLPDSLAALRTRLAAADWSGLADQAHQLRGATRYCAVPALNAAAEALELAAIAGAPGPIPGAFTDLEREAHRLQQAGG